MTKSLVRTALPQARSTTAPVIAAAWSEARKTAVSATWPASGAAQQRHALWPLHEQLLDADTRRGGPPPEQLTAVGAVGGSVGDQVRSQADDANAAWPELDRKPLGHRLDRRPHPHRRLDLRAHPLRPECAPVVRAAAIASWRMISHPGLPRPTHDEGPARADTPRLTGIEPTFSAWEPACWLLVAVVTSAPPRTGSAARARG
jgi:hypothetical protein